MAWAYRLPDDSLTEDPNETTGASLRWLPGTPSNPLDYWASYQTTSEAKSKSDTEGRMMAGGIFERENDAVVSTAKSYLDCPICFETLLPPIYQCMNGHVVCNKCIEKIHICGECRVSMIPRSRNVALENICRGVVMPCPNQVEGCGERPTVEQLNAHLEVCTFRPVNFCSEMLGKKECKVGVNDRSVLAHLEELHPLKKLREGRIRMWLCVGDLVTPKEEFHLLPLVLESGGTPILLRSKVSTDGHAVFTCFMLKTGGEEEQKKIQVKYRIESKTNDAALEWSGYAKSYKTKELSNSSSFRVSLNSLRDYCGKNQHSVPVLVIKVAVWQEPVPTPSLECEFPFEEVAMYRNYICTSNLYNGARFPPRKAPVSRFNC